MGRAWRRPLAGSLLAVVMATGGATDAAFAEPESSPSPEPTATASPTPTAAAGPAPAAPAVAPAPMAKPPAPRAPASAPAPQAPPVKGPAAKDAAGTNAPPPMAPPAPALLAPPPLSATARQLQMEAGRRAGVLAEEQHAQAMADAAAAVALETYQVAARRAEQAARTAEAEAFALRTAQMRTAEARATLARYLGAVYRTGVGNRRLAVMSDLIDAENPQALFAGLSMASRVGGNRNDQLAALRAAQAEQEAARIRSENAATEARVSATQAAEARAEADAAVASQKLRVVAATAALASSQQAAVLAGVRAAAFAKAEVIARSRSAAPPLAALEGAAVVRPMADCTGTSTAGFPNGMIPTAVLCPLWGTSGQMLRADAAAAFNAMSKKYAETFEAPICVTDSYRSYPEQVAVRIAKPTLAAVPGTSNHGWGVALDLCDGVQHFGSLQHAWLQVNAMAYGWFHPAWAQIGGSKPEAWHWEFAG